MWPSFSFIPACAAFFFFMLELSIASPAVFARNRPADISVVFQLPNVGSWFENLAVRGNGDILATRADVAEVWTINPATGTGNLLTNDFGSADSCLGIAEIAPKSFAVICGRLDLAKLATVPGTYSVFRVDIGKQDEKPQVSVLAAIPEAQFLNGMVKFDDNTLLVVDCGQGLIYKLDIHTGKYAVALQDATMSPNLSVAPIGVNGVKVLGNYVYYTSTSQEKFCRVRVNAKAQAVGPFEVVASGFLQDDFAFDAAGNPYICTNIQDTVITLGKQGQQIVVAGSNTTLTVAGSTAAEFGRTRRDSDTLYVTTAGALAAPVNGTVVEPAKVVAIKLC